MIVLVIMIIVIIIIIMNNIGGKTKAVLLSTDIIIILVRNDHYMIIMFIFMIKIIIMIIAIIKISMIIMIMSDLGHITRATSVLSNAVSALQYNHNIHHNHVTLVLSSSFLSQSQGCRMPKNESKISDADELLRQKDRRSHRIESCCIYPQNKQLKTATFICTPRIANPPKIWVGRETNREGWAERIESHATFNQLCAAALLCIATKNPIWVKSKSWI